MSTFFQTLAGLVLVGLLALAAPPRPRPLPVNRVAGYYRRSCN